MRTELEIRKRIINLRKNKINIEKDIHRYLEAQKIISILEWVLEKDNKKGRRLNEKQGRDIRIDG